MRTCTECKVEKSVECFHKKGKGLQSICKDCSRIRQKQMYLNNKSYYIDKAKEYRHKLNKTAKEMKNVPCADCGIQYPFYVMDFDHLDDKLFNIGHGGRKTGMNKLIAEIKKCEVVCSNCHRIRTFNRKHNIGV